MEPWWVKISGGEVGPRCYRRLDGLKLWFYLFSWRYSTLDSLHGEYDYNGWDGVPTTEQAIAWVDKEIPFHLPKLTFILST